MRNIIQAIYDFYSSSIPIEYRDRITHYKSYNHHVKTVHEKLEKNQPAKWFELMGVDEHYPPPKPNQRRHWASCTGHVRFEGLQKTNKENVYEIILGS